MVKWKLQRTYEDMAACDNKSKETHSNFYLCILGDIYKGVDNCRLSIIVDSALVENQI